MTPPTRLSSIAIALSIGVLVISGCASQPVAKDAAQSPANPPAQPAATPTVTTPMAPPVATDAGADTPRPFDLARPDIAGFVDQVALRHGWDPQQIRTLLAEGRYQPKIIAAISRPAERVLKWWEYRARLVTPERIRRGAEFWTAHQDRLAVTSARTGVDAAYIVAIIGVETNFGRNKGSWRVLDALMTLGFDYPPRQAFFRSELEQFLLLVREEQLDPLATLGSYAGAMGAPQFMPSSYRRFAVNGTLEGAADPRRDLFEQWDDVFASVANYFVAHGWRAGETVLAEASAPADTMGTIEPRNLLLDTNVGLLRERGVALERELPDDTPAILVQAELEDRPHVRVGFHNFTVITRYNRSNLYAMAVHDLAQAIEAARSPEPVAASESAMAGAP